MLLIRKYLCAVIFIIVPLLCKSATIIVTPADMLQAKIDKAHPGDMLVLRPGVYKQHEIRINKRLAISGEGFPIIDGENKFELFLVTADSVTINGLQIQNTGRSSMKEMAAINVTSASYVTIINNKLLNNTYGVILQNATNCSIVDNMIHANSLDELNGGNGVHGWKSNRLFIKGNSISGHRDGIYFEFVTESRIVGNNSFSNIRYGLHFMFSHNNRYEGNTFRDNGSGVAVMYSHGVIMTGNTFIHNWGDASYGLLLKEITDSKINSNHFIKNTVGIYMESTTRIEVMHNVIENNGWAMRIQANCSESNFQENNFIGNSFDVATNGTLVLNTFNKNYWDKYDGYDLDKNGIGDVPYYPVSVYSVITEKIPTAMILYRSFLTDIMDKAEKVMPGLIPEKLRDNGPVMKKLKL
jgi:nitrous oxidase accessory protein